MFVWAKNQRTGPVRKTLVSGGCYKTIILRRVVMERVMGITLNKETRVYCMDGNHEDCRRENISLRAPRDPTKPVPICSPDDADLLSLAWSRNTGGYAQRNRPYVGHASKCPLLHRVIMERILGRQLDKGEVVDHINGDRWDSRRENLRLTNCMGNAQNSRWGRSRGSSYMAHNKKWQARVTHAGKNLYLGCYSSDEQASRIAAEKRKELNFLTGALD